MDITEKITKIMDAANADRVEIVRVPTIDGKIHSYWAEVYSNTKRDYITSEVSCSVEEAVDDLMKKVPIMKRYVKIPEGVWDKMMLYYSDLRMTNFIKSSEAVNLLDLIEDCKDNAQRMEEME